MLVSMTAGIDFASKRSAAPCLRSQAQLVVRQFTDLAHDLDFGMWFATALTPPTGESHGVSRNFRWR